MMPFELFLKKNCRKIFIRQLALPCHIGAYDFEKKRTQRVHFDCEVWIPLKNSSSTKDDLSEVFNYDLIVNTITEISRTQHFNLQETLIDRIADKLFEFPDIVQLRLTSAKVEAYDHVEEAGIEVWRIRPDFLNGNFSHE